MVRPCFIIVDREYAGSISTRKLVIETAKLNVITAYSSNEALETLARYPAVDGIVMDAVTSDMPCADLIKAFKHLKPGLPVVLIGTPSRQHCEGADYTLESFEPAKLVSLLSSFVPQISTIQRHEEELSREGR